MIIRIKHNRENPYVQINKEALWNPRLSLKAVGLWAKCLSRPDDWTFHVKELAKSGENGQRSIYSAISELEEERYVLKLTHYVKNESGKFDGGGSEYIFFEFPYTDEEKFELIEKFKKSVEGLNKSFRRCCFSDCRNSDRRNASLLNTDTTNPSSLRSEVNEEEKKTSAIADPLSSPSSKKDLNPESIRLAEYLNKQLFVIQPKRKPPNLEKWAIEIDHLNRIDNRSFDEIQQMIDWALQKSDYWVKVIESPAALRRNWDKMDLQKNPPQNQGFTIVKNRITAQELLSHLKKHRHLASRLKYFSLMHDRVEHLETGEVFKFDSETKDFIYRICNAFEVNYRPKDV